jgi:hypothetical protein
MVKAIAGLLSRQSLPVFQSSPFEPYTCSHTAVRLMGSRLRGRAVQRNAPGTQLSLGRFRLYAPSLAGRISSDEAHAPRSRRFSGLASVSRALDTGPATHPLSLRQGFNRIKTVFPAGTPRPRQHFCRAGSGAGTTVHPASKDLDSALRCGVSR